MDSPAASGPNPTRRLSRPTTADQPVDARPGKQDRGPFEVVVRPPVGSGGEHRGRHHRWTDSDGGLSPAVQPSRTPGLIGRSEDAAVVGYSPSADPARPRQRGRPRVEGPIRQQHHRPARWADGSCRSLSPPIAWLPRCSSGHESASAVRLTRSWRPGPSQARGARPPPSPSRPAGRGSPRCRAPPPRRGRAPPRRCC